jgi:hypothetical protein
MLLSCGLGLLLLAVSTVLAVVAGFSADSTRGADAIFVLALISGCSAVILILIDLLVAYLGAGAVRREEREAADREERATARPHEA